MRSMKKEDKRRQEKNFDGGTEMRVLNQDFAVAFFDWNCYFCKIRFFFLAKTRKEQEKKEQEATTELKCTATKSENLDMCS